MAAGNASNTELRVLLMAMLLLHSLLLLMLMLLLSLLLLPLPLVVGATLFNNQARIAGLQKKDHGPICGSAEKNRHSFSTAHTHAKRMKTCQFASPHTKVCLFC